MSKIYYFLIMYLSIHLWNAQVGINTKSPHSSAALEVYATNKGISFPKISLQSSNDIRTIVNPKESLLVYNTNGALVGGKGFYFWNGKSWDFMFNDLNASNLQNLTKYYSATNNTTYNFTAPGNFYGNAAHTLKESITDKGIWTVITDLNKTITIDRSQNDIVFTITGMIQASNTINSGSVLTSIGIFIDDELVDIKPLDLRLADKCSYRSFKVYGYTQNVNKGSHNVKFAIRNRTSSQNTTVAFGGRNTSPSCSNTLTDDESKISSVILVNQPFNF